MRFYKNQLTKNENKYLSVIAHIARLETRTPIFKRFARFRWNYNLMSIHQKNLNEVRRIYRRNKIFRPYGTLIRNAQKIINKYST